VRNATRCAWNGLFNVVSNNYANLIRETAYMGDCEPQIAGNYWSCLWINEEIVNRSQIIIIVWNHMIAGTYLSTHQVEYNSGLMRSIISKGKTISHTTDNSEKMRNRWPDAGRIRSRQGNLLLNRLYARERSETFVMPRLRLVLDRFANLLLTLIFDVVGNKFYSGNHFDCGRITCIPQVDSDFRFSRCVQSKSVAIFFKSAFKNQRRDNGCLFIESHPRSLSGAGSFIGFKTNPNGRSNTD